MKEDESNEGQDRTSTPAEEPRSHCHRISGSAASDCGENAFNEESPGIQSLFLMSLMLMPKS